MEYCCNKNHIEVGIDEAGRGCLIGPVFVAAVIWNPLLDDEYVAQITDSKKLSKHKREELREYIELNAIDFSVKCSDNETIDEINILNATMKSMHECIDNLQVDFDTILVDGDKFTPYKDKTHLCIIKGDSKYVSIAAASILAKTYHDEWIDTMLTNKVKQMYDLNNNMGYGTKRHIDAIKLNGITKEHRKSFCRKF